ncbi:MAG: 5'-nucleotidase SurE [Firmicutes bacterium]|nr:5'-nucleotidase SurE [Bacillota bacterium]MDI6706369.1 5'/3'-nucleotidase SurE [Bacillota bacterium]
MRILITNDDGIGAFGIKSLVEALNGMGELYVVAPERERSAVGHAITMHKPLRANRVSHFGPGVKAWAVNGTPSDCVKLGVEALLEKEPDVVFSGINRGPNLGTDVLYSGTVSAAIEGAILGIPSAALSLASFEADDYSVACDFAAALADNIFSKGLEKDTLLNVNVPALKRSEIKGVSVTSLGTRRYRNSFEARKDPRGQEYFWMSGEAVDEYNNDDCDLNLITQGYITVTPIHFDLTKFDMISRIKEWEFHI